MPLQVIETEYCKDNVHYIADPELVEEKIQEAIKQCKKMTIPGYRPGKAPDEAIKIKMKPQIEKWVKQELQVEAYNKYIFDTKTKTIGFPQFNKSELHNSDYWCDFSILKKPKFELKKYKNFEIPKPHQTHTISEMVQHKLQELRQMYGEVVPYEDQDMVSLGDKITLDRSCILEGETSSVFDKEGELYTVTNSEFSSHLLGMTVGESKEFKIALEQAQLEEIRGKTSIWKVTIHAGLKVIPAPLNDELAKKTGFENYESLHQALEGEARSQAAVNEIQEISQQIIKKILIEHDFEVPEWLSKMEAQYLAMNMKITWEQLTFEQKNMLLEQGKNNVKLSLILDAIREAEPEVVFSTQELLNSLRQRLVSNGQNPEKILVEAQKDGSLMGILEKLRTEITLQWLISQSKVID